MRASGLRVTPDDSASLMATGRLRQRTAVPRLALRCGAGLSVECPVVTVSFAPVPCVTGVGDDQGVNVGPLDFGLPARAVEETRHRIFLKLRLFLFFSNLLRFGSLARFPQMQPSSGKGGCEPPGDEGAAFVPDCPHSHPGCVRCADAFPSGPPGTGHSFPSLRLRQVLLGDGATGAPAAALGPATALGGVGGRRDAPVQTRSAAVSPGVPSPEPHWVQDAGLPSWGAARVPGRTTV